MPASGPNTKCTCNRSNHTSSFACGSTRGNARTCRLRDGGCVSSAETIADVRPDWVYVPYADRITQAAAIESLLHGGGRLARTPIEAQLMRGKYGYPLRSPRERISAAAIRWLTLRNPWRVTHLLDPWILRGLGDAAPADGFRLIPEPVEERTAIDRDEARRRLAIPTGGRYVAMVGTLEPRKGIEELLAAFERSRR